MHTLRKDGFMYVKSRGSWASFGTKPLVLLGEQFTVNARAPFGEVHFQLADMESRPLEGFTFDDCVPLTGGDSLQWSLAWKDKQIREVHGKPIRLEVRLRDAEVYAFHGDFHFLDAQDWWMLQDGQPINPHAGF